MIQAPGQHDMGTVTHGPGGNVNIIAEPVLSPLAREIIQFLGIDVKAYRSLIHYNTECRELTRFICAALSAISGHVIDIDDNQNNPAANQDWLVRDWWPNVVYFAKASIVVSLQEVLQHHDVLQRARNEITNDMLQISWRYTDPETGGLSAQTVQIIDSFLHEFRYEQSTETAFENAYRKYQQDQQHQQVVRGHHC